MTDLFQPLDLTVNGHCKKFMKNEFAKWYMQQVDNEFRLSVIKPLHAKWLVVYPTKLNYNHMVVVIVNGFKLACIYDAIRLRKSSLQSIYPFNDIAPLADSLSEGNPGSFAQLSNNLRKSHVNELKTNQKMMKILNGTLRTISIEMLLTILLLMMNSRIKHYVISFISKCNLLFLVTLVMFKKRNEKNPIFLLIVWIERIWLSAKLNSCKKF